MVSTIAYAQLTNAREAAVPGTSTTSSNPGLKTYMDAFAALVPAEVLTLHAIIISVTTNLVQNTVDGAKSGAGVATEILPSAMPTLEMSFWVLVLMSAALYAVPRYTGGKWDRFDWFRMAIAPLAFVGWTMLQRTTAFDAAFPALPLVPRTVMALFLGAFLGAGSAALALMADHKDSQAAT